MRDKKRIINIIKEAMIYSYNEQLEETERKIKLIKENLNINHKIFPILKIDEEDYIKCQNYIEQFHFEMKDNCINSIKGKLNITNSDIKEINKIETLSSGYCEYCIFQIVCKINDQEFKDFSEKYNYCMKCNDKLHSQTALFLIFEIFNKIKDNKYDFKISIENNILCCNCFRKKNKKNRLKSLINQSPILIEHQERILTIFKKLENNPEEEDFDL